MVVNGDEEKDKSLYNEIWNEPSLNIEGVMDDRALNENGILKWNQG